MDYALPHPDEMNALIGDIRFVVERKVDSSWTIQSANKEWHNFTFVIDGESHYVLSGKPYDLKKGDLLFFPKGYERIGRADAHRPWVYRTVHFEVLPGNGNTSLEWLYRLPPVHTGIQYVRLNQLFYTLYQSWIGKQAGYLLQCRSIVGEILYLLVAHTANRQLSRSRQIEQAMKLMAQNTDRFYSINELSGEVGISPSHFRLVFKKTTGQSVIQYQNGLKINMARDLLLSGECNVTEAAQQLGFKDIYYFSKLFKKLTGSNPSAYSGGTFPR